MISKMVDTPKVSMIQTTMTIYKYKFWAVDENSPGRKTI